MKSVLIAEDEEPLLEVHLFDFDGDIYGRRVTVVFRHRIREERAFPNLDALKVQIQSDIREARAWLAAHGFPAGAPAHADLVST